MAYAFGVRVRSIELVAAIWVAHASMACGGDDSSVAGDAGPDVDAPADAGDAGMDSGPDADAGDAGMDSGPDGGSGDRYDFLSEAGFYSDFEGKVIDPANRLFEPAYTLWTDAADKARYINIPAGETIDTTDMDNWVFPAGTKVWKEFRVNGVLIETRLTEVLESGQVWQGSFSWFASDGVTPLADPQLVSAVDRAVEVDGRPEPHVIPSRGRCLECHTGTVSRVLGFQAVQLSHDKGGLDLVTLAGEDLLSTPPPGDVLANNGYTAPGTAVEQAALGYFHANCGHCHATGGFQCFTKTGGFGNEGLALRLMTTDSPIVGGTAANTLAYLTAVNGELRSMEWTPPEGMTDRVEPGNPANSAFHHRMSSRVPTEQMPPVYTLVVDSSAIDSILVPWINSLE